MIHLEFSPVTVLPEVPLAGGGPVCRALASRGPSTFREAAVYCRDLPYGANSAPDQALLLLEEGKGTCLSKHGLVALAAAELGLNVERWEGIYAFDDRVVTGVGLVLSECGLSFVPQTHCFLRRDDEFVDLTEGNCTGKNGLITDYFEVFPASPERNPGEALSRMRAFCEDLCRRDPVFAAVGVDGILEAQGRCLAKNTVLCRRPSGS